MPDNASSLNNYSISSPRPATNDHEDRTRGRYSAPLKDNPFGPAPSGAARHVPPLARNPFGPATTSSTTHSRHSSLSIPPPPLTPAPVTTSSIADKTGIANPFPIEEAEVQSNIKEDLGLEDSDGEGWQEMPVVVEDELRGGLDEEDQKRYRYQPQAEKDREAEEKAKAMGNATGATFSSIHGESWREKLENINELEYTRLRALSEHSSSSEAEGKGKSINVQTKYLFDEDKAMTPLAQMKQTKGLLTESQRIAYVGVCWLVAREMIDRLERYTPPVQAPPPPEKPAPPSTDATDPASTPSKEETPGLPNATKPETIAERNERLKREKALAADFEKEAKRRRRNKDIKAAKHNMELWALKIMGRLYYHMEIETNEQKMIESLSTHGVRTDDLTPALMTTHTVSNPEYDPQTSTTSPPTYAQSQGGLGGLLSPNSIRNAGAEEVVFETGTGDFGTPAPSPLPPMTPAATAVEETEEEEKAGPTGVSNTLSSTDKEVTLDIRWTVLCDLFLVLIADSVYDARSRYLLSCVATSLGLGVLDVVKFEGRVTEALEIQEDIQDTDAVGVVSDIQRKGRNKRYMMLGLATLGGGLVIGLSAGLLAPVIGLGLAGALGTIGIGGTSGFLAGAGGAAVITTAGTLTGGGVAVKGMMKRTEQVGTFELLPLYRRGRVGCVLTVPGFLNGPHDDPRLPFSVLDPIIGDVFSVLWEPEMIRETGSAIRILTSEVLSQVSITVLQATVMGALMSALAWPLILTKLGYLIDNPWNNALDRAREAGKILAEVLEKRMLGVRPITLVGFSLGARVIFYALLELAKKKCFGIVLDVFLLGTTVSVPLSTWLTARSVVSGRFVNAYAQNDWVLNYLFRASAGGIGTVAGLRPVEGVEGLENIDVTGMVEGHMSYRTFMPVLLKHMGFRVWREYFDDVDEGPEEGEEEEVQEVQVEEQQQQRRWWQRKPKEEDKKKDEGVQRPPGFSTSAPEEKVEPTTKPKDPKAPQGFDLNAIMDAVDDMKDESAPGQRVHDEPKPNPEDVPLPIRLPTPPPYRLTAQEPERPTSAPPVPVKELKTEPSPQPTFASPPQMPTFERHQTMPPAGAGDDAWNSSFGATRGPAPIPEEPLVQESAWSPHQIPSFTSGPSKPLPVTVTPPDIPVWSPPVSAFGNPLGSPQGPPPNLGFGSNNASVLSFGGADGSISSTTEVVDPLPSFSWDTPRNPTRAVGLDEWDRMMRAKEKKDISTSSNWDAGSNNPWG